MVATECKFLRTFARNHGPLCILYIDLHGYRPISTLNWSPMLPYGYSYKASCARPR